MRSSDVTFKKAEVPMETRGTDDKTRTMDIIEIKYPDGKVVGFPADMKSPETGIRYRDMYPSKYKAFANGEPDPDRVEQLQREIAERQAELDGMGYKAPDDERVQENLGYGDVKPEENPHKIEQPAVLGNDAPLQANAPSNLEAPSQASVQSDETAKEPA